MSASDAEPGSPSAGPWPGKAFQGSEITVYFDAPRCRHSAECLRGLPGVFNGKQRPWIAPDAAGAALVAEVIGRCPSGALHYLAPGIAGEQPDVPATVRAVERGPFLLRGDLRIQAAGGWVSDTRAALCRCTRSARQPFCDAACDAPNRRARPMVQKNKDRDPPGPMRTGNRSVRRREHAEVMLRLALAYGCRPWPGTTAASPTRRRHCGARYVAPGALDVPVWR